MLLQPFPRPGHLVAQAFTDQGDIAWLRERLGGKDDARVREELDAYGDLDLVPRPWLPESCPAAVRAELWTWLEQVVAWVNREHTWAVDRAVPACWPRHPHLIREIAVLAALRHQADNTQTPTALEEWHRYSLPLFIDRMRAQLGNGCQPGRHTTWPALTRHEFYLSEDERTRRGELFGADTERTHQGRPRLDVIHNQP